MSKWRGMGEAEARAVGAYLEGRGLAVKVAKDGWRGDWLVFLMDGDIEVLTIMAAEDEFGEMEERNALRGAGAGAGGDGGGGPGSVAGGGG